jgi:predicted transcriptional regulator
MKSNKGRLMMIGWLLSAIKDNPTHAKTRQFQTSGCNISVSMELTNLLLAKGFLRIDTIDGQRFNYHVTTEGLLLLKQINWCFDAVADKPKIGVMPFA